MLKKRKSKKDEAKKEIKEIQKKLEKVEAPKELLSIQECIGKLKNKGIFERKHRLLSQEELNKLIK